MRQTGRFLGLLLVGLALLTVVAHEVMARTTRRWFEGDVELRSLLAVSSASRGLSSRLARGDLAGVHDILADITRDERIMGALLCSASGEHVAATEGAPAALSCRSVTSGEGLSPGRGGVLAMTSELPGGPVHFSVVPLGSDEATPHHVVLVHDLSYAARREGAARALLLAAFFVLALGASAVTVVAARLTWRGWLAELRAALAGQPSREFAPLVRDVRELVDRISFERDAASSPHRWTPARLRSTLAEHVHGERVVIVANREPYIHERDGDGGVRVLHPASGLVTALEPVMRACSGVWVAHGSGSADRETVDEHDRVRVPPGDDAYWLRRVWLSEEDEKGYYYGFSNEGLWPLCHVAHARPVFRSGDFEAYRRVNQRFADAVCDEVDVDDPIILVQDYHFALAPRMIRERLPRAAVIAFWHIPWPSAERFGICPFREELIDGLLGASVVGFHTQQHCNNFLDAVDAFIEARIDRESNAVVQRQRRTLVRPYPISIEWPVRWLSDMPSAQRCREEVFAELGLPPGALLGVGIDRLDYTKGIEERLLAVDQLLERFPEMRGRFSFAQLAAPSRTRIGSYRDLGDRVEALADDINRRWGKGAYKPILLLRAHHEPPTVFRYFRAAHLCYVSSLHDGMNLVAKEFVAARDDDQGVLVLSKFTGAARELTEALIVNPYDLRQASDALAVALRMPEREQRERMRALRAVVSDFNVYRWAGRMLIDAAQLRRRERLTERLSQPGVIAGLEAT